jgi:hypothetical protein
VLKESVATIASRQLAWLTQAFQRATQRLRSAPWPQVRPHGRTPRTGRARRLLLISQCTSVALSQRIETQSAAIVRETTAIRSVRSSGPNRTRFLLLLLLSMRITHIQLDARHCRRIRIAPAPQSGQNPHSMKITHIESPELLRGLVVVCACGDINALAGKFRRHVGSQSVIGTGQRLTHGVLQVCSHRGPQHVHSGSFRVFLWSPGAR